jgi:hypothetical protein
VHTKELYVRVCVLKKEEHGLPLALELEKLTLEAMMLIRRKVVGGRRVMRYLNELRSKYLMSRWNCNVGKECACTRVARWTCPGARVRRNYAIICAMILF